MPISPECLETLQGGRDQKHGPFCYRQTGGPGDGWVAEWVSHLIQLFLTKHPPGPALGWELRATSYEGVAAPVLQELTDQQRGQTYTQLTRILGRMKPGLKQQVTAYEGPVAQGFVCYP
jgi:hypothetical protein